MRIQSFLETIALLVATLTLMTSSETSALSLMRSNIASANSTITVTNSDCQTAIDNAQRGDTIAIKFDVPCGPIRLRNKPGTGWITITTTAEGLPSEGIRVTPANDGAMAKILSRGDGGPAIETDAGAGFYKFRGIYVSANYANGGRGSSFLINLGNGSDSNPYYGTWLSHDITFDQCHIAGKFGDSRFAFAVSGERLTVTNSIVTDFANPPGADSAGFWFSNAGGHVLQNNEIQAGMWMIFMGGADSDSPNRARVVSSTVTSATLSDFEGVWPAVGDLVAFYIRPQLSDQIQWRPNTSYPRGTLQFHHSKWTKEVGRPPLLFYTLRDGVSGATEPDWNSFDEYHNQTKLDGSTVWRLFNGDWQTGKVTAVSGNSIKFVAEGGSGIFLPPIVGSTARWNGYSPSLISRRNWYHRPAHWPMNTPDKGMIQIKNGRNISFDGDLFTSESNWPGLMALTPGNQGYSAPWSTAQDIMMRNCFANHLTGLFNFAMSDTKASSVPGARVIIANNLFANIGGKVNDDGSPDPYSGGFWLGSGAHDTTFVHNTIHNSGRMLFAHGMPNERWIFRDNLVSMSGTYNFCETGEPWARCFPNSDFSSNVIVATRQEDKATWPVRVLFAGSWSSIGFAKIGGASVGDWALRADSPFKGRASDGKDPGVDIEQLQSALSGNLPSLPAQTRTRTVPRAAP